MPRGRPETHTQEAEERGPRGHTAHSATTATKTTLTTVATVLGLLGVVAGVVPGLWILALPIGVVTLAVAEPVRRRGPGTAGHRSARAAVVLAVVALALGVINLGISVELFDYFTVDGALRT